jgi:hypothetical protein
MPTGGHARNNASVFPWYVTWPLALFTVLVWFWDSFGDPSPGLYTLALVALIIVLLDVVARQRRRRERRQE